MILAQKRTNTRKNNQRTAALAPVKHIVSAWREGETVSPIPSLRTIVAAVPDVIDRLLPVLLLSRRLRSLFHLDRHSFDESDVQGIFCFQYRSSSSQGRRKSIDRINSAKLRVYKDSVKTCIINLTLVSDRQWNNLSHCLSPE